MDVLLNSLSFFTNSNNSIEFKKKEKKIKRKSILKNQYDITKTRDNSKWINITDWTI